MSVERRLQQQNSGARSLVHCAVGFALLASALWLVLVWLLSGVVARVFIGHQLLKDVSGLFVLMAAIIAARSGLLWASEVTAQLGANHLKTELRGHLTATLLALGPTYTYAERTGELVHTVVEGIEALDEYVTQYQPARLLAALIPLLVFGVVLLLDPWTLPILLFTGLLLIVLLALIGARSGELAARRFNEMSWMSAHFLDMLQGLPTLKLFGRSKEQAITIERISREYGNTTMDVLRTAFQTSLVLEWGTTAATALVAIEVSLRLMGGLLPFDRALAVLLLTPEFFLPLRQLAIKYHAGSAGKAAAERIYTILDTPPPVTATLGRAQRMPDPPLPKRLDIRFEDVHVAYDGGQRTALNGISLSITHGQTVALVGASGSGKTTVANLLLRFVQPTQGQITAGGVALDDIDADRWRSLVAWVPQDPHLSHGTLAENIRLARPDANRQGVVDAARAANAHDFIEALPHGYDTPIGELGSRLSGGERQRLAIARAFLKDAPLLILDEPTSHLDTVNERLIRDALVRLIGNRTVLIISHRLSLAYDADSIVVLDAGRVVQQGSPRALARETGVYRELRAAYESAAP